MEEKDSNYAPLSSHSSQYLLVVRNKIPLNFQRIPAAIWKIYHSADSSNEESSGSQIECIHSKNHIDRYEATSK